MELSGASFALDDVPGSANINAYAVQMAAGVFWKFLILWPTEQCSGWFPAAVLPFLTGQVLDALRRPPVSERSPPHSYPVRGCGAAAAAGSRSSALQARQHSRQEGLL